jgi:hypothetical protein
MQDRFAAYYKRVPCNDWRAASRQSRQLRPQQNLGREISA